MLFRSHARRHSLRERGLGGAEGCGAREPGRSHGGAILERGGAGSECGLASKADGRGEGINGGRRKFTEVPIEQVDAVLRVNLGGILLCTHAAMTMMEAQLGVTSHIYNTVGSGVKGGGTPGYVAYGSTKRGLPQMTESLVKEIEEGVQGYDKKETPGKVCCHVLSPGMVFTDLLLQDSTPELRKFPFGVLAAQPEEVAQDIVPKILNISGNGKSVEFLTTDRILTQFFKKFILGEKSEYIDDDGNVIQLPGAQYQDNGVRSLY